MTKQRKFTNDQDDHGLTEAEQNFLPKDVSGRKILDPGFEIIYDYELLISIVEQYRKKFKRKIESKIDKLDIEKINSGIRDYVFSTRKKSYNLDLLKCSLIRSLEPNILKHNYEISEDEVKQMISPKYFEKLDDFYQVDECWLINSKSLEIYQYYATKYTQEALNKFYKTSQYYLEDGNYLYRGFSNFKYQKNSRRDNNMDLISAYTGVEEPLSYFENRLLNSYTLNQRVAERFMMNKNSTRKALITAEQNPILKNVFSSFVVSEIFEEGQYEILCVPNIEDLYISEDVNDSICAEFHISDSPQKPMKMFRKNVDIEDEDE